MRELGARRDVDETLQHAIDLATELIRGVDVADIMFVRAGRITTPVATEELAVALDRVQQETGQGPCLSALQREEPVVVPDLADDGDFPAFAEQAIQLGIRSVAGYPLFVERNGFDRLGCLNLYGREPGLDELSVELCGVFATHCSTVLGAAVAEEGLQAALRSRDVIGQAKGILMERHKVTAEQAYDMLRYASNESNTKVRDLAERVTETGHLP